MTPTATIAKELETAFRHFNKHLFRNQLPHCVVLLHRHRNAFGYFAPSRWQTQKNVVHEVALNPEPMRDRTAKETLATLVHEQCHLWQQCFGTPPKRAYHNREWADKMESIGLMPSDTAQPGGKTTGKRVSHYILEGGLFDMYCDQLLEGGFTLSAHAIAPPVKKKQRSPKQTYTCPSCQAKVRGKPDLSIICGDCEETMA